MSIARPVTGLWGLGFTSHALGDPAWGELIQIDGCEQVARWRWQLFNKRDVVVCELVATSLFQALDTASRNA